MKNLSILKKDLTILVFCMIPLFLWSQNSLKTTLSQTIQNKKKELSAVLQTPYARGSIDSFEIDSLNKKITINLSDGYTYQPFRPEIVVRQKTEVKKLLGSPFEDYDITLRSMGKTIEELIPNYYRENAIPIDTSRLEKRKSERIPIVTNLSKQLIPNQGLYTRNITVWPSHGWYYDSQTNRWDWQRSRLFGTIEDKYNETIVYPYLVPMLENAGANVFLPRERDTQIHEAIVDADQSTDKSKVNHKGKWTKTAFPGFAIGNPPYSNNENPFRQGACDQFVSKNNAKASYEWIPDIPETGDYAVYISYQSLPQSTTTAHYKVYHTGGVTEFRINQKIGGGTWIYLGTFHFAKGAKSQIGKVVLSSQTSLPGEIITADAVRFGGGIGNIARKQEGKWAEHHDQMMNKQGLNSSENQNSTSQEKPIASNRPRFVEGARYYLQFAGMPDSTVYNPMKGLDDYKDDYLCRGYWVNYLMETPCVNTKDQPVKGLGIPVDLSLALHTDAGITPNDSIVGTLAIYSTQENDTALFPYNESRWASRDLTDLIQTQVCDDIKALFNPKWSRRGLWNKPYYEAKTPNAPAILLELLSHENIADMTFAHDPRFKFAVSRAIYKAMLRFIANQNHTGYTIQPLPVGHFRITPANQNAVRLTWRPETDPLEPTAKAQKYRIYTRIDGNGFDNGIITTDTTYVVSNLKPGEIYGFKIAAINEGGESFPTEVLAASTGNSTEKPVLIVNDFNRVSAPSTVDTPQYAGFTFNLDQGVSDHSEFGLVGDIYDFSRKSTFEDNDNPGWGASYGDWETLVIPGNTFDFSMIHGKAIKATGRSFISTGSDAFEEGLVDLSAYDNIDLLLGEEKTTTYPHEKSRFTIFTPSMRDKLTQFTAQGGNLLISGAYVGTDLRLMQDSTAIKFAAKVLHFRPQTNHASKTGEVEITSRLFNAKSEHLNFNTTFNPSIYTVEAPDAILPVGDESFTFGRYTENTKSAAVAYAGKYKTVILGFPLETITSTEQLNTFFKDIFNFFNNKVKP